MSKVVIMRGVGGSVLGYQRFERLRDAFTQADKALVDGYFLEAITIFESLLWDRLGSRLGFVGNGQIGFNTAIGQLCDGLVGSKPHDLKGTDAGGGCETDINFRAAEVKIQSWVAERNTAIHQIAKIAEASPTLRDVATFASCSKSTAHKGRVLLREFDELDRKDRKKNGKRPASSPNAFFPERRKE